MDHTLYKSARMGDIKLIKENIEQLNVLVTPNNNTILHFNIAFGLPQSAKFVEQVLEMCPPLLTKVNDDRDTPLHVAARTERVDIVEVLIKHARAQDRGLESNVTAVKRMLRRTNKDGNTALHEAAQNYSLVELVKLLMREDDDFPYDSVNNDGETALYVAASRGSLEVVVEMLETCTSTTYHYKGPRGMTILHAAVKRNHLDITRKILEKKTNEANKNEWSLTKEVDANGWTALHYAAYYGHRLIVKLLVEFDAFAASIADRCRKMTALHLAAGRSYYRICDTIINNCPTCIEQVDDRGWNYVHFAMCNVTSPPWILRRDQWPNYLLNAKDVKGNTPLLVLALISQSSFDLLKKKIKREFIESTMQGIHNGGEQFHQLKNEVSELSKIRTEPYTKGVLLLCDNDYAQLCSLFEKEKEMYLITIALIATVTYTAGLTLPGGYIQGDSNQGTAVLIKNSAFQAFVISNAMALVLSVLAIVFHILSLLSRIFKMKKDLYLMFYAHAFTIWALTAMVVAFVTGTYAILRPSLGLAIVTVMVGLSVFPVWYYVAYKFRKLGIDED